MKLNKYTKLNAKGFSHIEAILGVLVVAVLTVVGVRILTSSHAATPPDQLAYSVINSDSSGNNAIYTVNPDGTNNKLIITGNVSEPTWNSNKSELYYVQNGPGLSCIYFTKTKKIKPKNTNVCYESIDSLHFSQTTNRLTFIGQSSIGQSSTSTGLYVTNSKGKKIHEVLSVNSSNALAWANWSPLGNSILYYNEKTGYWNVATISPKNTLSSNSQIAKLTNTGNQTDVDTAMYSYPWSNDGSQLSYVRVDPVAGIGVMNSNGTNQHNINSLFNNINNNYINPEVDTWSPNGSKIAFAINGETSNNYVSSLWIINPDGSSPQTITTMPESTCEIGNPVGSDSLVWSSDSSYLAYICDNTYSGSTRSMYIIPATPNATPKLITNQNVSDLSWRN